MKNILIGFLSGIIIVGGCVWYFSLHPFTQTTNPPNKTIPSPAAISPTEKLIGGDKDDHGCLIAAGYQWCEIKQKCLRSFEEACSQSETTDILDIAKALAKKNNWERYDNLKISISKNDGTYASGGVHEIGSETGGGMWFAKKVNGVWEIVTDGNGVTLCSSLTAYPDYPSSLLPECFDDKKGVVIKR